MSSECWSRVRNGACEFTSKEHLQAKLFCRLISDGKPEPKFSKMLQTSKKLLLLCPHDDQWLPKVAYEVFIFNTACIGTNASTSQERKTAIKGNHKRIIALINWLYYKTVSEENVMVSIPHTSVTIEHTVKMAPG